MRAFFVAQPGAITTPVQRMIATMAFVILSVIVLPTRQASAEEPAPQAQPATARAITTTHERYIVPGTVPYAHQVFDTAPDFGEKASACGSTSLAMALGYLGKLSGEPGAVVAQFHPLYSFGREPAEEGLRTYGAASRRLEQGTEQEIVDALERGHVVIAGTQMTAVGHIVLMVGYERVGDEVYLIVNDPWGDGNEWDYEYTARDNGEQVRYSWARAAVIWSIEVLPGEQAPAKLKGTAQRSFELKGTLQPRSTSFWSSLAEAYSAALSR